MGTVRGRKRNRIDIKPVPNTLRDAVLLLGASVPSFKVKKWGRGGYIKTGSRLWKWGLSPEDEIMLLAPQDASAPERMVYGWLVKHDIPFSYQISVEGGRLPGGSILDFVINLRPFPLAIRIQSYWHTLPTQKFNDAMQLDALEELGWEVCDVWDYEINTVNKANETLTNVLYGWHKQGGLESERAV